MTISKDLFLAILSMDSYNRGYGAGLGGALDGLGSASDGSVKIGAATVSYNLENAGLADTAQAAGFYAIAYDVGGSGPSELAGKTVISYRGTDTRLELITTDWPLALNGDYSEPQVVLASDFYKAAKGDKTASEMVLTGHSLGGGLAA